MASKKKRLSLIGRYVDTFFPLREELTGEIERERGVRSEVLESFIFLCRDSLREFI